MKLLLYLLFFFLPTQLGRHFWFDFSYKLGSRVDYLSPTIYFTDILIFIIIIFYLIYNRNSRCALSSSHPVCTLFHCSIATLLAVSIGYWLLVLKQNPYLLVYNLLKLIEMVVLGLIIAKTFTRKDFPEIIKILNLTLILQVCLAAYQAFGEKSAGLWIIGERDFSISTIGIAKFLAPSGSLLLRGYGTFPHPNVFGGFCLLTLAANTFCFLQGPLKEIRQRWQGVTLNHKLWFLFGFIFSLLGVWLSMSLLAIGLSQVFLWGVALKFLKLPKLVKIFLVFPPILFFTLYSLLLILPTESFSRRLTLLAVAREEFLRSPVLGVGLGNFIPAMGHWPIDGRIYFWQPAHNVGALLATETGVVGVGLASYLVWRGIKKFKNQNAKCKMIIKNSKIAKKSNFLITNYQLLIISWWLIIFLTGLFDHYWLTLQQGRLLLALVTGLSFIKNTNE